MQRTVVIDDLSVTRFLERELGYQGYSVETTPTSAERPAIDAMLPGPDGPATARRLPASYLDLPATRTRRKHVDGAPPLWRNHKCRSS